MLRLEDASNGSVDFSLDGTILRAEIEKRKLQK
jgi:hypothetical protein